MGFFASIASTTAGQAGGAGHGQVRFSKKLIESAALDPATVLNQMNSSPDGLPTREAAARLVQYGSNEVAREARLTFLARPWGTVKNPLVILLAALGVSSVLTGDTNGAIIIGAMVLLGIVLRFVQESRADHAAARLQAMVNTTVSVVRGGQQAEVPLRRIVPGDVVVLYAGDMVPAV